MNEYEKELVEEYQAHFNKLYNSRYWLVVVNNHFDDIYSFFIYSEKVRGKIQRSYELVHFPRDPELYDKMIAKLKSISKLSIEYRDTRHLIHPGEDITHDTIHGHGRSTKYDPKK
ncbi:hypothetical protein ACFQ4L_10320 [Lapidilactobacillus mulanensis]|uniref:Acetyl-CoA carboxylase n=1 Tax=Lapidilactobacillus mulanensis TaxID=2485999 RepID=A0ABW4DTA7_9LACO|nr:hypothetical protein [Lapidilactobacillus mulanensis]